ncbi:hypothetical protein [Actinophytocola xinjiangensis]|nr:hypothetical protein [Actinophytocola xinjiangensis]
MAERPAGPVPATMRVVLLGVAVAVQFGLCLSQLVGQEYRARWVAVVAFVALAVVSAACAGWVSRRTEPPVWVVAGGTVVVLAAAFAATALAGPAGPVPDWSFGLVGWHLLVLLLDRVGPLLVAFGWHVAVSVVWFPVAGSPDRERIAEAGTVALGTLSVQLAVALIARMLHRRTAQAMAVAAERDRLATRVLAVEQAERGQRDVFAGQLGTTLPLLADLADGVLDPRGEPARRRCALAATQLRRLFAENDEVPDPLVHEVSACLDVAERRGVDVSLAVSGAAVAVPAPVRRELTAPVAVTLSHARTRARVSVLRTATEVRVAVVSDAVAGPQVAWAAHGVEVESGTYGEYQRTEARWSPPS